MARLQLLYDVYERRLAKELAKGQVPAHIGVILDGNRRWARSIGQPAKTGHRRGADKITEFLQWCEDAKVQVVTLWMLSTDNLRRGKEELEDLLEIIAQTVEGLAHSGKWRLRLVGSLPLLPASFAQRLQRAVKNSHSQGGMRSGGKVKKMEVNIAVGYGGRDEIIDAVRELLLEKSAQGMSVAQIADSLCSKDLAQHLYTKGQPDPDLVIRTSGEQRLSGFLLWQTAHAEFYFCETYWPEFRHVDFLRALRDFAQRERRHGL